MDVFLVGGAVRDQLLKLPLKDKDYLVVGASAEQMLKLGYQQVGKDFPVFLHPKTRDEYALARTEKKITLGHKGFSCYANSDVTLEQDLSRRDLTINAIAQDENGNLYDPFNGVTDIKNKVIRHVSPAFAEDPLRVLRVARFAAKLHLLGFSIAPETMALMQTMSQTTELQNLTPERVWQEFDKALETDSPQIFIQVLRQCGALRIVLPEIDELYILSLKINPATSNIISTEYVSKNMQNSKVLTKASINKGIYSELILKQASILTNNKWVRFAALTLLIKNEYINDNSIVIHSKSNSSNTLNTLFYRLRVPNSYKELANTANQLAKDFNNALNLKPEAILALFDRANIWRKPENLKQLTLVYTAALSVNSNNLQPKFPQGEYLQQCFDKVAEVSIKPILNAGFKGAEIKEELKKQRLKLLEYILQK